MTTSPSTMIRFDCHAHVYERIRAIPGARYVPGAPAPLDDWLAHVRRHGVAGGVIVQVSFLGTDNTELCDALCKLDPDRFAGVAVVTPDVDDRELERLVAAGVRGFRWNLVGGAPLPDLADPTVRSFLERLNARDLHIEVHLESPRLAGFIGPLLAVADTVVVDHLGLPADPEPSRDPWLQAIARIENLSGLYVKFSGAYRTPFDTRRHEDALLAQLLPDRAVWGSDWPHTRHERDVNYERVADERHGSPIARDTAATRALYGLRDPDEITERPTPMR